MTKEETDAVAFAVDFDRKHQAASEVTQENCGQCVLAFGKFKGYSFHDVALINRRYLKWLFRTASKEATSLTYLELRKLAVFLGEPVPEPIEPWIRF